MTKSHPAESDKSRKAPTRKEITITGFGGQGVVLTGKILGQAAALGDHMQSTLVQAYGPEARGGACSAQVIISELAIHFPYVRKPHILVCMSQSGFDKYIADLSEDGTLITDQDLVEPRGYEKEYFTIPATRMAEELGRKMMANIIMLGFLTAVTAAVTLDAAQEAVVDSVPKGTEQLNLKAFQKGFDFGEATLKGRKKRAIGEAGA
jgi:2-oxoglutarate ferredoxin oxidoreductase subunit gamma